ncbi:MAG: cytochrome c biogenesis protein CcsA [Muribaculaceae bacterium]|nr:cytochrome c biogenesis protein CcsA [Muribaculaceae bacterium]
MTPARRFLLFSLHLAILLLAVAVGVSSFTSRRGGLFLTLASPPASVSDDAVLSLGSPVALVYVDPEIPSCLITSVAGSDTLTVSPNNPALWGTELIYLVECNASSARFLIVSDFPGFILASVACIAFFFSALILLIRHLFCHHRWICNIRIILLLTALLVPVSFMLQPSDPTLPILRTPWLVIHLVPLIAAYALIPVGLAIALRIIFSSAPLPVYVSRLHSLLVSISLLLGIGIVLGSMWASLSWGRFWGWDIKETWALIAFIAASLPLHFPVLYDARCSPKALAFCMVAVFLLVVATYLALNPFGSPSLHAY